MLPLLILFVFFHTQANNTVKLIALTLFTLLSGNETSIVNTLMPVVWLRPLVSVAKLQKIRSQWIIFLIAAALLLFRRVIIPKSTWVSLFREIHSVVTLFRENSFCLYSITLDLIQTLPLTLTLHLNFIFSKPNFGITPIMFNSVYWNNNNNKTKHLGLMQGLPQQQ